LKGAFAQDYSPLEIVIYDDCSADGTDEMVRLMIDEYKRSGGRHTVVYERGAENIGNIRAAERLFTMARGEICIQNDGDDISLPNRVSKTVEAWLADGKKAKLIWCEGICIDEHGNRTGRYVRRLCGLNPRGAMAAYSSDVYREFPPVEEADAYDDRPYALRARLLGPEISINEGLVLYRLGTGESTKGGCRARKRSVAHTLAGVRQMKADFARFGPAANITDEERREFAKELERLANEFGRYMAWYGGESAIERFRAGVPIGRAVASIISGHLGAALFVLEKIAVLLPNRINWPLRDALHALFGRFARKHGDGNDLC